MEKLASRQVRRFIQVASNHDNAAAEDLKYTGSLGFLLLRFELERCYTAAGFKKATNPQMY